MKSIFESPIALSLIIVMAILLVIIILLARNLMNAADLRLRKRLSDKRSATIKTILLPLLLTLSAAAFGQDKVANAATPAAKSWLGDLPANTFYLMLTIIFLELAVIVALVANLRLLIRNRQEKFALVGQFGEQIRAEKQARLSWWDRFNALKPVSEEADLDLGHDADGIRELDNRLPPWWLYGFYATIIFAAFYLWRFHISHTGPSSEQEYETSVARAQEKIDAYLKSKGEAIDENTVKALTATADLDAGKAIYMKSCITCHKETGAGDVGPNLTDDYWLHGNTLKDIFKTIRYGINAMPQWQMAYSNKQIAQVASYVKTLHGTNPPNPKAPQGVLMKEESGTTGVDSTRKAVPKDSVAKKV